MTLGLLGQKKGMTQIFDTKGMVLPITVIQTGPCTVVQTKSDKSDGYHAIQLGFGLVKAKRLRKSEKGHFEKKKVGPFAHLKEFRIPNGEDFQVGQALTVQSFKVGDRVDIQGVTKGRGFQGVIKREGFSGGPDSHGSDFHRRPGSIGQNSWPSRVFKNMRMAGRMGGERVLTRNLEVVGVNPEENILLVRGAVPGAREGLVIIYHRGKDFVDRFKVKVEEKKEGV